MDKRGVIKRVAGLVTAVCSIALLAGRLPTETWVHLGQRAALASVSLQQADKAAQLFATRLQRVPLGVGESEPPAAANGTIAPMPSTTEPAPTTPPTEQVTVPTSSAPSDLLDPPAEDGSGGKVVEQTVSGGTVTAGIAVKNQSGVAADIAAALADGLPFSIEKDTAEPQVLIYHTHATETYMPYAAGYYNSGDTSRVPENPRNVRAVGDALAAELTAAGIAVLHDTTLHDSPQYRGAYDRSAKTVEAILAEYPSIKVVLDIHRDGLMLNSRDKLKPTVTVDGKKAAQVMLVCGVLSTDALPHKEWRKNLRFAAGLQQKLATVSSGFARPLSLVSARYNQHLSVGSLLIEVGSEGNTLDEATYSAQLLGRALAGLLSNK